MNRKYNFEKVVLTATWPEHDGNDGGFILSWVADIGFGELAFYNKDGKTICSSEYMSENFVKQALNFWLIGVEIKD